MLAAMPVATPPHARLLPPPQLTPYVSYNAPHVRVARHDTEAEAGAAEDTANAR